MEAVRRARPEDAQRCLELASACLDWTTAQRGGPLLMSGGGPVFGELADPARFPEWLADPSRLVLMGTLDEVVTGIAAGRIERFDDRRRIGRLDGCYVEPEARGMGIGRLLVDTVLDWLRVSGCIGVDGMALPGDRAAKNFFETAGFKARLLTMHRSFD